MLDAGQILDGAVVLNLRPNPWEALGASIFPLAPEQPHENLTLYVNYETPGKIFGTLEIPVAIRFRPPSGVGFYPCWRELLQEACWRSWSRRTVSTL